MNLGIKIKSKNVHQYKLTRVTYDWFCAPGLQIILLKFAIEISEETNKKKVLTKQMKLVCYLWM